MNPRLWLFLIFCALARPLPARAADGGWTPPETVKITPKDAPRQAPSGETSASLIEPDVDLIDAPTAAVLAYGGYSTLSRFFSNGGILEQVSFGVFQRLNIGGSLYVDRLIGNDKPTRLRSPNVAVKYRFYDGERLLPSLAVGFDGQGRLYNQPNKLYNNRQRGFYVVATEELWAPGLLIHPSFNISDFNSNSIFGAIPLSFSIRDKVNLMLEWDNINTLVSSRLNAGARFYVTGGLHIDFAARSLGQGGVYSDNTSRGPERIVQIGYAANF